MDKQSEQLSAFIDGEETLCAQTLAAIAQDPQRREQWRRYHLARDILKGSATDVSIKIDVTAAVREQIEREDQVVVRRFVPQWSKAHWVTSGAIAASVLMVMIQFWQAEPGSAQGPGALAENSNAPVLSAQLSPQALSRLQGYVSGERMVPNASPVQ